MEDPNSYLDPEIAASVKDTLSRQIVETRKLLEEQAVKNLSKELPLSKKLDNAKGRLIIASLLLKKQLADHKSLLEDSRKQWALDYQKYYNSIYAANTSIKQAQFYKIKKYTLLYKYLYALHTRRPTNDSTLRMHTDVDLSDRPIDSSRNNPESLLTDRHTLDQVSFQQSETKTLYLTHSLQHMLNGKPDNSELKPDWVFSKLTMVRKAVHKRLKILRKIELERVSFLNLTDSQSLVLNTEEKPQSMLEQLQIKSENMIDAHRRIFSFSQPDQNMFEVCANLISNPNCGTDTQPSITHPTCSQYTPTLTNEDQFEVNFEQEIMGDLSESSLIEEENIRLAILNSSLLKDSVSIHRQESKIINTSELDSARLGELSCLCQSSSGQNSRNFFNMQGHDSRLQIKCESSIEERGNQTESEQRNLVSKRPQTHSYKLNFLRRVCKCFYID